MERITQKEYWDEVEEIARDAVEASEGDDDALDTYIHETVDGHEWLIYTFYHSQVLDFTDNREAGEEFNQGGQTLDELQQMFAFFAMRADVYDQLEYDPVERCYVLND